MCRQLVRPLTSSIRQAQIQLIVPVSDSPEDYDALSSVAEKRISSTERFKAESGQS